MFFVFSNVLINISIFYGIYCFNFVGLMIARTMYIDE